MYQMPRRWQNKTGDNMDKIKNLWECKRRSNDHATVLKSLAVTLFCLILLILSFVVTGSLIGLF